MAMSYWEYCRLKRRLLRNSPTVQVELVQLLAARRGDSRALRLLFMALDAGQPAVQCAAVHALRLWRVPEAWPRFLELARQHQQGGAETPAQEAAEGLRDMCRGISWSNPDAATVKLAIAAIGDARVPVSFRCALAKDLTDGGRGKAAFNQLFKPSIVRLCAGNPDYFSFAMKVELLGREQCIPLAMETLASSKATPEDRERSAFLLAGVLGPATRNGTEFPDSFVNPYMDQGRASDDLIRGLERTSGVRSMPAKTGRRGGGRAGRRRSAIGCRRPGTTWRQAALQKVPEPRMPVLRGCGAFGRRVVLQMRSQGDTCRRGFVGRRLRKQ